MSASANLTNGETPRADLEQLHNLSPSTDIIGVKCFAMLKVIIFILLLAMIVSLFTGLNFLFKDSDKPESRRVLWALGIRVGLAITALGLIYFGLETGQLELSAPWHNRAG